MHTPLSISSSAGGGNTPGGQGRAMGLKGRALGEYAKAENHRRLLGQMQQGQYWPERGYTASGYTGPMKTKLASLIVQHQLLIQRVYLQLSRSK